MSAKVTEWRKRPRPQAHASYTIRILQHARNQKAKRGVDGKRQTQTIGLRRMSKGLGIGIILE